MTQFKHHYIKFVPILLVAILAFAQSSTYSQQRNPLLEMLASIPQEPVLPQMNAMTISYADYRAIEQANGVPSPANRHEYTAMDDNIRTWWQLSLLRIHAGPASFANLTNEKIADMPELMGFDYFDMDHALTYGADPYIGTIVHSDNAAFDWATTSDALSARGYEPRRSSAGIAWGQGGDGQTDIDNIALGDPFGGDVGLASRVAVFDSSTVANSFIWGILLSAADAYTGDAPSLAELPVYRVMADTLQPTDGELLQAVIVNQLAGEAQQPVDEISGLPPYELAAIADVQVDETQVHRVVAIYGDAQAAQDAADTIPNLITDFDNGWFQTIGFEMTPAEVIRINDLFVVTVEVCAPAPTPQDVIGGAFEPGIVFGFWATAIQQGNFYPFALTG